MPNVDKELQKEAIKEALKEWMNEQFAAFGRWTFASLMAAAFAGIVYLALKGQGWSK
jgi:hypothetical protein